MNKKMIWLPSLAFSLMLSQSAFATMSSATTSSNSSSTMNSCPLNMNSMLGALKLNDMQLVKIKEIKTQAMQSIQTQWQQMKSIRMQMNALVHSNKMDEAKLDALIVQKKELMAAMMKTKMMAKHQIYNVLNKQQKMQFQQMMKKMDSDSKQSH